MGELSVLASQADKLPKTPYTGVYHPYLPSRYREYTPPVIRRLNQIRFKLRGKRDLIQMYLFERHKLKDRLLRYVLDGPPLADQPAWRRFN